MQGGCPTVSENRPRRRPGQAAASPCRRPASTEGVLDQVAVELQHPVSVAMCRRRLRRLCRGRHVDISAFSRYRCQQVSRVGLLFFGWVFARGRFSWVEALAEHAEPLRLKVKRSWIAGESNPLTSARQTASTLLRLEIAVSLSAVLSAEAGGRSIGTCWRGLRSDVPLVCRASAGGCRFRASTRASQPPACLI